MPTIFNLTQEVGARFFIVLESAGFILFYFRQYFQIAWKYLDYMLNKIDRYVQA